MKKPTYIQCGIAIDFLLAMDSDNFVQAIRNATKENESDVRKIFQAFKKLGHVILPDSEKQDEIFKSKEYLEIIGK